MEIFYINVNLLKELVYLKSQSSTRFFFYPISGQSMLFTFGFLVGHILEMILHDHVSCPLQGENQPWRCIALTWTHRV